MNRKSQVQSNATKNGKSKILVLHKGQIYTVRKLEETKVFSDCLYFYRFGSMTHAQYKVHVKNGHKVVEQENVIEDTRSLVEYMTKHMGETMCFVGISNAVMGRIYERYTHNRRTYM